MLMIWIVAAMSLATVQCLSMPKSPIQSQFHEFDHLKRFQDRCQQLSKFESDYMLSFWSEKLQCFQIFPNNDEKARVSITTTCITLLNMFNNPVHWKGKVTFDTCETNPSNGIPKISIKNTLRAVYESPWNDDIFQKQSIVHTFSSFKGCDKNDPKYVAAVESLLINRSKVSLHRNQELSAYLRHQNVQALLNLADNKNMIPDSLQGTQRIGYALERANLVAFDELCRQLAFYNSGDNANFDVIVLTYSLLTYYDSANSLFLTSFARGVIPSINYKLVTSALKIIFESQASDGTWRKGEPINKVSSAQAINRDIGNNYVFFFDLITSILSSFATRQPKLLAPYLTNFERCVEWAENNVQQEMLSEQIVDRQHGKVLKGWRSNHLGTGGAVAWCTAQVFSGLTNLSRLLKTLITNSILEEFGGKPAVRQGALVGGKGDERDWKRLMDSDLKVGSKRMSMKGILYSRLLKPQAIKERESNSLIIDTTSNDKQDSDQFIPLYSLILFGPPGTAKTTICSSLANYLGWNFLTIDTACFLAEGLENIAARMTYVFQRLNALERTIILFDEIEEFCLDRENPALGMESRLLTTAMLTQLNDLRRKQSSIFIVATNRLRSFDAAVIRPGRFDMLLFVGTPNLQARIQRLRDKLASMDFTRISNDLIAQTMHTTSNYLEAHWEEVRFFSFAENEMLLTFIKDSLVSNNTVTVEMIDNKVQSILRTATIQGQVKIEYVASESLSRL